MLPKLTIHALVLTFIVLTFIHLRRMKRRNHGLMDDVSAENFY